EREYWAAWEASKKEREITTTEQLTGGDGDRLKAVVRKEQQTGDPRYLAGVQSCIEQRCKLLGLNAPVETRLTGQDGGPIQLTLEAIVAADRDLENWQRDRLQPNGCLPLLRGDPQVP